MPGARFADHSIADIGRRGHTQPVCCEMFAGGLQGLAHPRAAGDLPLKAGVLRRILEALDEGLTFDGDGVADLKAGKSGHQLAGPAFSNAKEFLNGKPVQLGAFEFAQFR